ncbi:hypothetical protein [Moorena bouillonii]|uniref:PEP-CTERM protein-sorting domain-containing protein n=1 Tax=Moorena bouillonii PNG TaxID=568701 RepID=A0A1U7N1F1_9CYAN|nr:hypothetical protein [Moorena bouillonii]OLT59783.1 hypothetical protein BJP37_12845 [Moorena bouillonii PNG]
MTNQPCKKQYIVRFVLVTLTSLVVLPTTALKAKSLTINNVQEVEENTNFLALDQQLYIKPLGQTTTHFDLNPDGQLDVIPGNGGIPEQLADLVLGKDSEVFAGGESVLFTDLLNKPNSGWQWQTRIENINPFEVSFPFGFFFPGESSVSVSGNLSLAPAAGFEITILNPDNPPEVGDWIWSVESFLNFPIGIDTVISENSTIFVSELDNLLDLDDLEVDTNQFSFPPPFSLAHECNGGCSFFESYDITTASYDITTALNFRISVPEPGSVLSLLAFGAFGIASALKGKQKQKPNRAGTNTSLTNT